MMRVCGVLRKNSAGCDGKDVILSLHSSSEKDDILCPWQEKWCVMRVARYVVFRLKLRHKTKIRVICVICGDFFTFVS